MKKIKRRLNSGNACYHSVQNIFIFLSAVKKCKKLECTKTIILLVVLYGYETWSLTLKVEHRLRVCENRVLKSIFGPKREEVMGVWRNLDNEELHDLTSSPSTIKMMKSRRMRWAGDEEENV
jgi:hypothetical protein